MLDWWQVRWGKGTYMVKPLMTVVWADSIAGQEPLSVEQESLLPVPWTLL